MPVVPQILSTGGYHDTFLKFIGHVFNSKIVKCHDYINFVTKSIDYLNHYTNNCFYIIKGQLNTKINQAGKMNFE